MTTRIPLMLILFATMTTAHATAQVQYAEPCSGPISECIAVRPPIPGPPGPAGTNGTNGKDGTDGTDGKDGKDAPGAVVCPPIPARDLPAPFDFTVSTLIENDCAAQVLGYDRALKMAVLVDLRTWKYQVIVGYMNGPGEGAHDFTRIDASRTDPYRLVLSNTRGFWVARWPVASLNWNPIP